MSFRGLVPWRRGELGTTRDPFVSFQREMSELMDRFFSGEQMMPSGGEFVPDMDVTETDKEIRVSAELPGVEEKDVDVSLSGETLTIRGEKKAEKEEKYGGRHFLERTYGSFERRFALPCDVDAEHAKAEFKKGVLTL